MSGCAVRTCTSGLPATHESQNPLPPHGWVPVCSECAELFRRLDDEARAGYRMMGDPRADRPPLVRPLA